MRNFLLWVLFVGFLPVFGKKEQVETVTSKSALLVPSVDIIEITNISSDKAIETLINGCLHTSADGVLLVINSGGGDICAYGMMYDLVRKLVTLKPVVVFVYGMACSGGYMMACPADWIIAPTKGAIGSIGVSYELERTVGDLTITEGRTTRTSAITLFRKGRYKALNNSHKGPLTPEELTYIEERLEKDYQDFINLVAKERGLDILQSEVWAEGRVFDSREALQLGLIDEVGTVFEAFTKLVSLIHKRNPYKSFSINEQEIFANANFMNREKK